MPAPPPGGVVFRQLMSVHLSRCPCALLVLQARDYRGAITVYTQGIEACLARKAEAEAEAGQKEGGGGGGEGGLTPEDFDAGAVAALYGNRAASHVMILGYEQAISDCDSALALNPNFPNVVFRKAMALKKLVSRVEGAG